VSRFWLSPLIDLGYQLLHLLLMPLNLIFA
jgi:hypothetical protein